MSSSKTIAVHDHTTLGDIRWERMRDGEYARSYLEPLMISDPSRYVQNVQTRVLVLAIDDRIMPLTINEAEYDNSYVCSPYTHYVTYAREELDMLGSPVWKGLFLPLLSTNLYHEMTAEDAEQITEYCVERYPDHIIAFRSVCRKLCPDFYAGLRRAGYILLPSRYVYLFHPDWPAQGKWRVRNTLGRDRQLLARSGYRILSHEELGEEHAERIVALYNALYLDKYSQHNPQFTTEFIRLAMQKKTLTLIGLEKEGSLDGILGYFQRNGVMTTPLFGYDTSLPKQTGLYRMLSSLLVREAERQGILLHQSAGVGAFKADRGAVGEPEYTAVYVNHLPKYRRGIWQVMAFLLERIGIRMVEKYKL